MDGWTLAVTIAAPVAPTAGLVTYMYIEHWHPRERPHRSIGAAERIPRPATKFGRDVAVNVVANLIAAAIIYILGVLVGLLPGSPALIFAAAIVVLIATGSLIGMLGVAIKGRLGTYFLAASIILLGIAGIGAPFVRESGLNRAEKIVYPIGGIGCIAVGLSTLRQRYRDRRTRALSTRVGAATTDAAQEAMRDD